MRSLLVTCFHLVLSLGCIYFLFNVPDPVRIFLLFVTIAPLMPVIFLQLFLRRPLAGRPRWHLHLSTCMILMLTASIILGLNMASTTEHWSGSTIESCGWPATIYTKIKENTPDGIYEYQPLDHTMIAFNVLCALDLLAAVALLCELTIRQNGENVPLKSRLRRSTAAA